MSKYSQYFALEKKLSQQTGWEIHRSGLIHEFTSGKKNSLKALSHIEFNELCNRMREKIGSHNFDDSNNRMRRKIISRFRKMGYERNGKADMPRIYAWVKQYGKFRKPLNRHDTAELSKLVSQVELKYENYLSEIHRPVTVKSNSK